MRDSMLTSGGLEKVAERCPGLRVLDLRDCPLIDDEAMKAIAIHAPALQELDIGNCPRWGTYYRTFKKTFPFLISWKQTPCFATEKY
jgi:hypothetical protein